MVLALTLAFAVCWAWRSAPNSDAGIIYAAPGESLSRQGITMELVELSSNVRLPGRFDDNMPKDEAVFILAKFHVSMAEALAHWRSEHADEPDAEPPLACLTRLLGDGREWRVTSVLLPEGQETIRCALEDGDYYQVYEIPKAMVGELRGVRVEIEVGEVKDAADRVVYADELFFEFQGAVR
jgi:hypothetical protein